MRAIFLAPFLEKKSLSSVAFVGICYFAACSAQNCSLFFLLATPRLSADDRNVVAVHCKGGKGRTGTMICILLVEFGVFRDADQSLEYFGQRRTDRNVSNRFQVRGDNFFCSVN